MKRNLLLIGAGAFLLIICGMRLDGLPFTPEARFSDSVTAHWMAATTLREAVLERGMFPVWRETLMAGEPFAANPLNKTAYPLQWLVLLFPPIVHLNVMILLHLGIAAVGMWMFARALGLREDAAALSALAYACAPKLLAHVGAGHLDLVYAMAWFPLLLRSVHHQPQTRRQQIASVMEIALLAALIVLADVRLSLFALTTAAAYALYRAAHTRQTNRLIAPLGALIPFTLMTVSVIAPILLWQPYMTRAALTPADAGLYSLDWGHFAGLIIPSHQGNVETLTYLGLSVLVLSVIALIRTPRAAAFWIGLLLIAVLYALGSTTPIWSLLVQAIPGLLWFRVPSRAWFVVALAAAILAGYGLQALMTYIENRGDAHAHQAPQEQRNPALTGLFWARLFAAGMVGMTLVCGGATLLVPMFSEAIPFTSSISVVVIGLALGIVLLAVLYDKMPQPMLTAAILLIVVVDLGWTARAWMTWKSADEWLTPYAALAQRLQAENAARIYSPSYSLPQQAALAYDLRLFGGVDPFQLTGIVRGIEAGSGIPVEGYNIVLPPLNGVEDDDFSQANRGAVPDTAVLGEWQVSHVIAGYSIEHPRLRLVDTVNGVTIYANQDYVPLQQARIPDWPDGWAGLPQNVAELNLWTVIAAVVGGGSFLIVLVGWAIVSRKTS